MGRKRKTTQQFIEDARKIHGDRYDYSKVEYINVNTEVCIICPKHGEFWDTPARHLRGDGCPKCKFEVFGGKNKRKWTHETCYEEAKKYNNIKDFNKRSPSAYYRAKTEGWLGEYVWLAERKRERKALPRKWTYENCYEEAKKYKQRSEFERASSGAYRVALKNGWLDDYTWFAPYMSHPAGYWTYERCYEEAKKYKIKHHFKLKSSGAYNKARAEGWLSDYNWFSNQIKQNSPWTYERCYEEAKKYKSKQEFRDNCDGAYRISRKNEWFQDYTWLSNSRIENLSTDKIDSVYVYKFEDGAVYVGRTLMVLQKHRHGQHKRDRVGKYAKEHHITIPQMEIIEDNLTLEEGLRREDYWVKWFKEQGYTILNKAKTGVEYGSLGALSLSGCEYNYETCYEEAKKYKTKGEFRKSSGWIYKIASYNNWLKDYNWFKYTVCWTHERCYEEAKKYKSRSEFMNGSNGAYKAALKNKWMDEYTWFVRPSSHNVTVYWTYEKCREEAKKYKTRSDFMNGSRGAYNATTKNKWMDDFIPSVNGARPLGYWDIYENVEREAKKYETRGQFCKVNRSAYNGGLRNGWLDELFPKPVAVYLGVPPKSEHRADCIKGKQSPRPCGYWNIFENVKDESENCHSRNQLYKTCRGAYNSALRNGWLDILYPLQK